MIENIMTEDMITIILLAVAILLTIFLIFREFNCWYWKVNRRIKLVEEQNILLTKQNSQLAEQNYMLDAIRALIKNLPKNSGQEIKINKNQEG